MKTIKVFLSSSSEGLEAEREAFATVMKEISRMNNICIIPYRWEKGRGFISDPNNTIQEGINKDVEDSSFFVFIFYNKLGTGVRTEFEKAVKTGKKMFIYIKDCVISQKDRFHNPEKAKRFDELNQFVEGLDKNHYILNFYDTEEQFEKQLREKIDDWIKNPFGEFAEAHSPSYKSKIQIDSPIPINNLFVGRLDELEELSQRIDRYETVAVYGMGGMGKTSLTAQYCKTHFNDFQKVIWVTYHNSLEESILSLRANYSYNNEGQLGFGDIVSYLNSIEGEKLMVFDNFDIRKDDINSKFDEIKRCFPGYKKIFTTRTDLSSRKEEINIINLEAFNNEEAIQLFKNYYTGDVTDSQLPPPQVTPSQLTHFIKAVYGHTLMIELVAKTLSNHFSMNMAEILGYLKHETELEPTASLDVVWHHQQIAIKDLSTMLYNTDLLSNEECRLLEILAILCEESVDVRFLMNIIAPDERRRFEDLVNRLSTEGWINKTNYCVTCHRILADIILKKAKLDVKSVNTVLRNLATMTSYNALDDFVAKRSYYQMQRSLLTYLCNQSHTPEGIQTELVADNAINYYYNGSVLDSINKKEQTIPSSEIEQKQSYRFLKYAKQLCADKTLDLCHINECLSRIYIDYKKYDDALEVLQEALKMEEELQGGDSLDKAKTLYELANFYYNKGDNPSALPPLTRSYEINSNLLGDKCVENIDSTLLFIKIFKDLSSDEEVRYWADNAQSIIDNANMSELNPKFIHFYIDLSYAYKEKMLDYLNKAETLTISIYGETHPLIGDIYWEKQNYYYSLNEYDNMINCLNKWYDNENINFGYSIVNDFKNIYWLHQIVLEKLHDDGDNTYTQYFDKYNTSITDTCSAHPYIPYSYRVANMNQLGMAYYYSQQFEMAARCFKNALMVYINESHGYNDGQLFESLDHLYSLTRVKKSNTDELFGQLEQAPGKYDTLSINDDTEKNSKEDYAKRMHSKLSSKHDGCINLANIVESYLEIGQYDAAMNELNDSVIIDYFKDDTFSTCNILFLKGKVALYMKQFTKADDLFNLCLTGLENEQLNEIKNNIATAYNNFVVENGSDSAVITLDSCIELLGKAVILITEDNVYKNNAIPSNLAYYYLKRKEQSDIVEAERLYRNVIFSIESEIEGDRITADLRDAYSLLGVCYLIQGNTEAYFKVMSKATEEGETEPTEPIGRWTREEISTIKRINEKMQATGEPISRDDLLSLFHFFDADETISSMREIYPPKMFIELCEGWSRILMDGEIDAEISTILRIIYVNKIAFIEKMVEENSLNEAIDINTYLKSIRDYVTFKKKHDKEDIASDSFEHALSVVKRSNDDKLIAETYFQLAKVYRDNEEYEKAECHYKESVKYMEKTDGVVSDLIADRLINVGVMLARQEKYDECLEVTERALSLTSEDNISLLQSIHSNLAYLYKKKGEHDKAVDHYQKEIAFMERQGEDVSPHALADKYDDLGIYLFQLDRNDVAIEMLEHALKIIGKNEGEVLLLAVIHSHLALVFQDDDKHKMAEQHYKKCINRLEILDGTPGDLLADYLIKLGVTLECQEKYEECLEVTERALSLTSADNFSLLQSIHSNLTYLYKKKGEHDKAVDHYQKEIAFMERQGEDVSPHALADKYDDLGIYLFQLDRNDEAIEALEHALQIIGEKEDEIYLITAIHNHLAQIYQDMIEVKKAELHKKEFDRLQEEMDKMRDVRQDESIIENIKES